MTGPLRYDETIGDTGSGNVSKAAELMQLFEDLRTQAKSILGDDWNGAAADAFDQAHANWNAQVGGLGDAHATMGKTVVNAMHNAFSADQKASGLFNV